MIALIIMMIAPYVDATIDETGMAQPSTDASKTLIDMSINRENQSIDPFAPENTYPNLSRINHSDSNSRSGTIQNPYINYPKGNRNKLGNSNELPDTHFSAIRSKLDKLYETTAINNRSSKNMRIADSNAASDINTNLEFLNRGNADEEVSKGPYSDGIYLKHEKVNYDIVSNLNYLSGVRALKHHRPEQIRIADSDTPDEDARTGYAYKNKKTYNYIVGTARIASSDVIDHSSKTNYIYESDEPDNYLMRTAWIATSDIRDSSPRERYVYESKDTYNTYNTYNYILDTTPIASSDVIDRGAKTNYIYESDEPDNYLMRTAWVATSDIRDSSPRESYVYESKDTYNTYNYILDTTPIASSDVIDRGAKTNYIYESDEPDNYLMRTAQIANSGIVSGIDLMPDDIRKRDQMFGTDQLSRVGPNLNSLPTTPDVDREPVLQNAVRSDQISVLKNLDIIGGKSPYPSEKRIDYYEPRDNKSLKSSKRSHKKDFAVVIGIDNYKDRMDLHTSVNDAKTVASLLEMYGYDVMVLTDDAHYKPTKHNILEVALAELKRRQNRGGNIIIYYSGHGFLDNDGDYYLIPQDANGIESTYISENELNKYIKDIKNLAVIIDACHSGALCNATGESQLMLASSRVDEPSNEEWIGSLSVFTHNLCDAIEEHGRKKKKILLQSCFSEAYNETIQWASGHMLSQTPILKDLTPGKAYYLN